MNIHERFKSSNKNRSSRKFACAQNTSRIETARKEADNGLSLTEILANMNLEKKRASQSLVCRCNPITLFSVGRKKRMN